MSKNPKEVIEKLIKNGRLSFSYSAETVYSCIKKGDKLEIEDNREKFKNLKQSKDLPFKPKAN